MIDLSVPCRYPAQKPERNGYVRYGRRHELAHRRAWVDAYGPIPTGQVVDHACHNADASCPGGACPHRACIEPLHLQLTSSGANTLAGKTAAAANAAKTHCPAGHEYTPANTYTSGGRRTCRRCTLDREKGRVRVR